MFSSLWSRSQIDPSILSYGDGSDQEHRGGKCQGSPQQSLSIRNLVFPWTHKTTASDGRCATICPTDLWVESRLNPSSWPGLCRTNPDPIRWLGTCQERIWARPVRRHRWFPGGWGIFETRVSGQNLPCLSKHVPMKHVNPMANPLHLPWQTNSI